MTNDFHKFSRPPHLAVLADSVIRDAKGMSESEREMFLRHELVVAEKVDGTNLAIPFDGEAHIQYQNRGAYFRSPFSGQWKNLSEWLIPKTDILFEKLTDRHILFKEWCYAQHSVFYNQLPDCFWGFDIFDKESLKFLSRSRRDAVFLDIDISGIPVIKKGRLTQPTLERTISISRLSDNPAGSIYLRFAQGGWLQQRAKLVHPKFIQSVGKHWSRKGIEGN